jgi:hypothetical protein
MPFIIQPPAKKKRSRTTQKGGAEQDFVVHPWASSHHQAHAGVLAASATLGGSPELIDAEATHLGLDLDSKILPKGLQVFSLI